MPKDRRGRLIIISGPSGAGKTTLADSMLRDRRFLGRLEKSISVTSRPARKGEIPGRDYIFVSEKMFLYKIRAGHFLEWARVFGAYYGTPRRPVENLLRCGKCVLLTIDVQGADAVASKVPDVVRIFIRPPSLSVLEERLRRRADLDDTEIRRRLAEARREIAHSKVYDWVVVNDRLPAARMHLASILSTIMGPPFV